MLRKSTTFLIFLCYFSGVVFCLKQVTFWNKLAEPLWIGGHAEGYHPLPDGGGWLLEKGEKVTVFLPDVWKGNFWPRTWCNQTGLEYCETGNCDAFKCRGRVGSEPYSTIEFRMRKTENDEYSISLAHGFNTNVKITPKEPEEVDSDFVLCPTIECELSFTDHCPEELRKHEDEYIYGCRSPCDVFQEDHYCCRGEFNDAATCQSEDWPTNYAKLYKEKCPRVKSYLHDTLDTVHFCRATNYLVEFSH